MTEDAHSMDTPGEFSGDPLITPIDWQRRLSASVAAHAERTAAKRNERAEFARRRNHGLERRQSAKLARNNPDRCSPDNGCDTNRGFCPTDDPRSHQ